MIGAGNGSRTRLSALGRPHNTDILYLRRCYSIYIKNKSQKFQNAKSPNLALWIFGHLAFYKLGCNQVRI